MEFARLQDRVQVKLAPAGGIAPAGCSSFRDRHYNAYRHSVALSDLRGGGADFGGSLLRRILPPNNPTAAASAGIHTYDGRLEDYSSNGVSARVAALKSFEAQFEKQPAGPDRDLILNSIRASLLEAQEIRSWEKNPDLYSSGITYSAFVIMSRSFAPPEAA